ncbi:MAG TPA: TonB-dependent receptor [Bryobacteraceae bacterium]|nr:TonB-dependent receptor [Bryobacteraceae bacterium]
MKQAKILLIFVCLSAVGAWAQTGNATLSGTVHDASGGIVAGATVQVRNVATAVVKETVTNESGLYYVPNLIPGTYSIDVSAKGFQNKQLTNVTLVIDQRAGVDVELGLGAVTEQVTVTGAPPLLQTQEASVGAVVQAQTVQNLPLNGRYYTQLLQLVPGAAPATQSQEFRNPNSPELNGKERNGTPAFAVNGNSGTFTMFLLDGVENSEREFGGSSIPISIDAIQEVKMQTNNFSAEYGRSNVQVAVVTKSGTDQFHGSLYEYLRNDALDATNWTYSGAHQTSFLKRNQFGGTFGGPIKKDKLFFFFNYEGMREVFSSPKLTTVPSNDMRQGIFPSGVIIFDPLSQAPFPNNTIPSNRFNSITNNVVNQLLPTANLPGQQTVNKFGFALAPTLNYAYNPRHLQNINQYNTRIDYTLSAKDSIFGRHTFSGNNITGEQTLATNIDNSLVGFEHDVLGGSNLGLGWVHSFSPTVINQATFGLMTNPQQYNKGDSTDWATKLGMQQDLFPGYLPGLPRFIIGSTVVSSGAFRPLVVGEKNFQWTDALTLVHGTHTIKLGVDIRKTNLVTTNNLTSNGRFDFTGVQTRDRNFPTVATTFCSGGTVNNGCTAGNAMADFLLGYPSFATVGSPVHDLHKYFSNWAGYATDTWKVLPRLTITLGLRYEYQTRWHADPAYYSMPVVANGEFTGKVAVAQNGDGSLSNAVVPALAAQVPGSVIGCTSVGLPSNCLISEKKDFAPRFGLAWQVNPKTVFRLGGGLFYGYFNGDVDTEDGEQWPLANLVSTPTYTRAPAGTALPPINLNNVLTGANAPQPNIDGNASNPSRRIPQTYEWNVAIEREIARNLDFSIAYVGSVSRHIDYEEFPGGSYNNYNIPQPWGVVLAPGQTQQVAFPQFSAVQVYANQDNSNYNALQARLEQRMRGGLSFVASYAYGQNLAVINNQVDPRCPRCTRGPTNFDLRNTITVSPIYELPFGKGRQFPAGSNRAVDALIGGWRLTSIMTWHGGFPFSPTLSGTDLLNLNGFHYADLPDQICDPHLNNPTPYNWFNKSCYALPVEPTTPGAKLIEGNAGWNSLRGPNWFSLDTGISKTFSLTERYAVDFRGEFFNILNHPDLGLPAAGIAANGNSSPATISAVQSIQRVMQFAIKLHF